MLTPSTEPVPEPALYLPSPHQASANQSWHQTPTGPGHWLSQPHFCEEAAHKQIISHFQEKQKISPHIGHPISSCCSQGTLSESWRKPFLHSTPQREGSIQAQLVLRHQTHTRLADKAQGLQEHCTLPERKLKFRPDVQATDFQPLPVTRSTSEHFPC